MSLSRLRTSDEHSYQFHSMNPLPSNYIWPTTTTSHIVPVRHDPNPVNSVNVPATMNMLNLPKILSPIDVVIVRDDYNEAVTDIEA